MLSTVGVFSNPGLLHRIATPKPVDFAPSPASRAGDGASDGTATVAVAALPQGQLTTPALTSQLLQIDPSWLGDGAGLSAARAAGAYGLASMPETAMLTPTPPKYALEDVSGLGFIPGDVVSASDPAALTDYLRGEVADAREAARREKQLSEEAGVAVKLAYDPNTDSNVALRPGDAGYDELAGAQASFARMRYDLPKMGVSLKDFADLLQL